jgi:O-acetyl-ADP-ribose deacetylase (regulator of RNase III)
MYSRSEENFYTEIEGDLINLAYEGMFDVIAHGCNCFCTMGAGIAVRMAREFGCDKFPMEDEKYRGDINKLGQIDYKVRTIAVGRTEFDILDHDLTVVNIYSQYKYGKNHSDGVSKPIDYEALTLGLRKMNHIFKGKQIGLPMIGAGLAGGDWDKIKSIIQNELADCKVIVVKFNPN